MDVIETGIDKNSDEYRKNYQDMETLVGELQSELKKSATERSEKGFGLCDHRMR